MRMLLLFLGLSTLPLLSSAQTSLDYAISFPGYMHHEAVIAMTVHKAPQGPLVFRMSRSSPGRYATHEFGKNVYYVHATGPDGQVLEVRHVDGDVYEIPTHGQTVTLEYTLFGDRTDGTYVGIDRTHAHFNMPGAMMWLVGADKAPITISWHVPDSLGWKIATQLVPTSDPYTFTAPGLQYMMDCPTELSNFRMATWQETNPDGKQLTFRVSLHADIADDIWAELTADIRKVVEEEQKIYGEFASYDYGTYTFILDANGWANGDGMEHRNSTCITLPIVKVTEDRIPRILDVVAHEFFHSWNVKRIRPKTIEPFDFTKSNMSDELWVAEGFTQYYGNLALTRAGFTPVSEEIGTLGMYLNAFIQSPGAKYFTAIQSSNTAVFSDAGVSIDKNNFANTFFSYYLYGANIACLLDLHLRKDFHKTLDDYMKVLWKSYGKTAHWYNVTDLQTSLAGLTTPAYAQNFFARYVYSTRHDDWGPYFVAEGLKVVNTTAGKAGWGNVSFDTAADGHVVVVRGAVKGTAFYDAGLDVGDEILSLDGHAIAKPSDISDYLSGLTIGKTVLVEFSNRRVHGTIPVTLVESEQFALQPLDGAGDTYKALQQAWLGPQ